MKVLSWNVNGRVRAVASQAAAIHDRHPDVVTLQEVTEVTRGGLRQALTEGGLTSVVDSFELLESTSHLIGPRRYGLLVAARFPLRPLADPQFSVPWPERILGVQGKSVSIFTTYIPPGSSNGWKKIEMFEGLYAGLAKFSAGPRILSGDFNAPQFERANGDIITWGQYVLDDGQVAVWGRCRGGTGQRWDAGERNVLRGLSRFDLADVFRTLHGYQREEFSWYLKCKGVLIGRRFDHVFASASLQPTSCTYLHALREAGLSDHSPIEVVFSQAV
jgi:exonuclease III